MRISGLRRDSLWMTGGQVAAALLQAVYFVLIGRTLGSEQYGAFIGIVALVSVGSQCSGLGMDMLLLRDVSRNPLAFGRSWGRALQVTALGALLLMAVVEIGGRVMLRRELWPLLIYVAVSDGLFGRVLQIASRAFQATRRLRWAAALPVVMNALRAGIAVVFHRACREGYLHGTAQDWVRLYWMASAAAALVAMLVLSILLGGPKFERLRRRDVSEGVGFALSSSSISLYNDLDKSLLLGAGQMEAAGIYGAAYRVVDVATTPIYGLFAAATPRFFRAGENEPSAAGALSVAVLKRALPYAGLLSLALFCFAGVLPRVLGHSFGGAVTALRWLCLLPVLRLLHYTWGTAITASTSQWARTGTQAAAAGLNLGLCLWMIPRWSWQGAAIASLFTDGALVLMSFAVWNHVARCSTKRPPVSASSAAHLEPVAQARGVR